MVGKGAATGDGVAPTAASGGGGLCAGSGVGGAGSRVGVTGSGVVSAAPPEPTVIRYSMSRYGHLYASSVSEAAASIVPPSATASSACVAVATTSSVTPTSYAARSGVAPTSHLPRATRKMKR